MVRVAEISLTGDGDTLRFDIDLTMMEPTERRIIDSHLRAIGAVVKGAKPQGNPDPAPMWRRLVDAVDLSGVNLLPAVLYDLHWLAGVNDTEWGEVRDKQALARIVAICEQQIGSGKIDPDLADTYGCTAWGLLHALMIDDEPTPACWWNLGDAAAHWLAVLTGDAS